MLKINVLMSQHSAGLKNLTVQVLSMLKVMIDGNSFFKILDGPCHRKKHLEMSKHYEQKFSTLNILYAPTYGQVLSFYTIHKNIYFRETTL
jgi:hypothetical protein